MKYLGSEYLPSPNDRKPVVYHRQGGLLRPGVGQGLRPAHRDLEEGEHYSGGTADRAQPGLNLLHHEAVTRERW